MSTLRPDSLTLVITPRRSRAGVDLRELLAFHELLYFLIWRDLKVRYRQTVFGALWAVIQPTALMVVFTLVLGRAPGLAPAGVPYPLFVFAALVPWTFFSQSVVGASSSLVGASNLIQKVYFPRLLLPLAAVGSYLIDFGVGIGLLAALMLYFGTAPTFVAVFVIPLILLLTVYALAVGVWLAAINVRYRDVRHAVPFVMQVWLFASPVAYSLDAIPKEWRALYSLNPMAGAIEMFRWAVLGIGGPPIADLLTSLVVATVILGSGLLYFRRVERTFADVI